MKHIWGLGSEITSSTNLPLPQNSHWPMGTKAILEALRSGEAIGGFTSVLVSSSEPWWAGYHLVTSSDLVTHRKFTECLEVSKDCGKIVWDYLMLSKTDRIPQQNPRYIDAMILTNPEQSWCNHATFWSYRFSCCLFQLLGRFHSTTWTKILRACWWNLGHLDVGMKNQPCSTRTWSLCRTKKSLHDTTITYDIL